MIPKSRIENTRDAADHLLPIRTKHPLADEGGRFPVEKHNLWELAVVDKELGHEETVAWYRNPSSPTSDALQVPYPINDAWKPMQPDFIFFSLDHDGGIRASIVDPHGDHQADAMPKLRGLAGFAERYSNQFLRIDAVSKVGDELRVLDFTDASVRNAVETAASANSLYKSDKATP